MVKEEQHAGKSHVMPNRPIVGIGASAGGVEALERFFKSMPADSGMGFVV
jgi:chemotaxis response regulator CheB